MGKSTRARAQRISKPSLSWQSQPGNTKICEAAAAIENFKAIVIDVNRFLPECGPLVSSQLVCWWIATEEGMAATIWTHTGWWPPLLTWRAVKLKALPNPAPTLARRTLLTPFDWAELSLAGFAHNQILGSTEARHQWLQSCCDFVPLVFYCMGHAWYNSQAKLHPSRSVRALFREGPGATPWREPYRNSRGFHGTQPLLTKLGTTRKSSAR